MLLRIALCALLLLSACERGQRGSIVLVPMGEVPPDLLVHLQHELQPIMNREITIAAAIPRPEHAFNRSRRQYLGTALLQELERLDNIPGAERVLGVIDADAYAPGLNFIFGQARKPGRVAVIALPRLRDSFRGRPENTERFRVRAVKEAVHELGHSFDLAHCPDSKCVMHFSNSFGDTDRKTKQFCSRERFAR